MTKRLENLTENTLVEKIKYLEEQLKDMKTLQTVGSESWLQISSQWQWNWTSNTSYTSLVPSRGVIDFDTWMNYSMYFECLMFTDGGTGYLRLYNETDSTEFTGSELTTTTVGESNAVLVRSSKLTKPTGAKTIKVQGKRVGGSGNVNCMVARVVMKIEVS